MTVFVYDGSFEGLLTAIYEAWYSPVRPGRIEIAGFSQISIGEELQSISTDMGKAAKVSRAIHEKLGRLLYEDILHLWMSEAPETGTVLHDFLRIAFRKGPEIVYFESEPTVNRFLKLHRAVVRESHRLLGLARFMELESGVYYCALEPDQNILLILAAHFADRLGDQPWVIHDIKRGIAAFYDTEQWQIREFTAPEVLALHEEEKQMQELWREYFKRIAIAERNNPNLQRQLMPKKYWKYLTEKQG